MCVYDSQMHLLIIQYPYVDLKKVNISIYWFVLTPHINKIVVIYNPKQKYRYDLLNLGSVILYNVLFNLPLRTTWKDNIIFYFVGNYGDVIRVKILFNKKDTALIQFNDPQQAQTGNDSVLRLNALWLMASNQNHSKQEKKTFEGTNGNSK